MIIIAVGKNYVNEVSEKPAEKGNPVIFTKPESSLLKDNASFKIPEVSNHIAYELELAFRVSKSGKNVSESDALNYVDAVALAIDFTAKDVLNESREKKGPWALAKGFDGATPLSGFQSFTSVNSLSFTLDLNGERVQDGNPSLMIFSLPEIIAYVTQFMTINPGDVILTGTPAHGTGAVKSGDRLTGSLNGEVLLDFDIK